MFKSARHVHWSSTSTNKLEMAPGAFFPSSSTSISTSCLAVASFLRDPGAGAQHRCLRVAVAVGQDHLAVVVTAAAACRRSSSRVAVVLRHQHHGQTHGPNVRTKEESVGGSEAPIVPAKARISLATSTCILFIPTFFMPKVPTE